MADMDPCPLTRDDGKSESDTLHGNSLDSSGRNGTPDAQPAPEVTGAEVSVAGSAGGTPPELGDEHDDRFGLEQAEVVVDHLAERISSLVGVWGRKLLRLSSRARESAQDFWADVQCFRYGKKP
jgi:hypothetical protein